MILTRTQQSKRMKKILIVGLVLLTLGLTLISSSMALAQGGSEFVVPLSDPAKRGKLKAHLNYGSITVKGTARKDVLVKYKTVEDDEEDGDNDSRHKTKVKIQINHNNNDDDE